LGRTTYNLGHPRLARDALADAACSLMCPATILGERMLRSADKKNDKEKQEKWKVLCAQNSRNGI
jgi:hypothetical protein